MALRYAMAGKVAQAAKTVQITDGRIIVELAHNGEASFVGHYVGTLPRLYAYGDRCRAAGRPRRWM